MGKYTAHNDPIVDHTVTKHLSRIVSAICAHLEPQSIILHGSFGRGEGSIMLNDGQLTFLSDYEILVVTHSPFYRRLFVSLSQQLTTEMDVEVSISWMRPGRLRTNQPRNLSFGRATPTITMYELKEGGQTLYGQEMLTLGPTIDPREISIWPGIRLLINRMTEALHYSPLRQAPGPLALVLDDKYRAQGQRAQDTACTALPQGDHPSTSRRGEPVEPSGHRLETVRWINKLVLACAEALLLLWGEYHYSYAERGRRFAATSGEHLPSTGLRRAQSSRSGHRSTLPPGALTLPAMVERATCFKLRPTSNLYPEDIRSLWPQVITAVDAVFRHLMAEELDITFNSYTQFPKQFLSHSQVQKSYNLYRLWPLPTPLDQKLINAVKYLRQRRWPPRGYLTHFAITANLIVFALVPLLFLGWSEDDAVLAAVNAEVRRWLALMGYREPPLSDPQAEWNALYQYMLWAWKNFCYF